MLGDGIRRDIATISDEERTLFVNAIRTLDDPTSAFVYGNNLGHEGADGSGNITYWDMQEQIHKDAHVHGIDVHAGPAFVPWHRDITNRMEGLLRMVDPRLSLHYWDWTTDPRIATADRVAILTGTAVGSPQGFLGSSSGNAGAPLADFESTEITGDPALGIPGDGVHDHIWRQVSPGPSPVASDSSILLNLDFTSFNTALQSAHNDAHGYIGGSLGNAHFSFHDPMVFLLHSNMDRLWATWQRDPAHKERLDPAKAYGTILADEGLLSTYFDAWVQPWAGIFGGIPGDPQNGMPGTNLNPWKSDVSQQARIPYTDPSIVIPVSFDTAPHASYIIVNRDTFSNSEVTAKGTPATFPNAFSVVYDGFEPTELGVTTTPLPAVPPNLPTITFTGAGNIQAVHPVAGYEDPGGAIDMPQRIIVAYDLRFANANDFPSSSGGENFAFLHASLSYNIDTGTGGTVVPETALASTTLALVNQPNPYMIDVDAGAGNPYWLSIDTRVFQVKGPGPAGSPAAGSLLGVTQGDMDADSSAPFTFIDNVLSALQASPSQFDNPAIFPTDETTSELELSQKVGPVGSQQRVYNYVVAKVRYLAPSGVWASSDGTGTGTGVSVFFRAFSTAVSALDYDATSGTRGNYRRTGNTNASSVPLLGIENDSLGQPETGSIPFFAAPRVRASSSDSGGGPLLSMTAQPPDTTNIQTINGTGSENVAFFGAWLDLNLAPGDPNYREFPLNPDPASPDGGPFTVTTQSIQQLMLNTHHCVVAEIFFWPSGVTGDPIPHLASPASSDRLAQRNLVLVRSGNPGFPATHRVQSTFIVKPSVTGGGQFTPGGGQFTQGAAQDALAARAALRGRQAAGAQLASAVITRIPGPDELIIRWNNVPRNSEASIYMPEVPADEILALSALRQHPAVLRKLDANTLGCRLADVTFIPLPMNRKGTIAGLISVTLPDGIRAGQVYRFSVEQYSGFTLKTLGAFQMTIPVRPDAEILPDEIRKLSVLRYIQQAIPSGSRWYSIFLRYLDQIAARVRGFGGDPCAVQPAPDGSGGILPPPVCPPGKPAPPPELFCLNIPWQECDIEGELELKLRFRRKCK